MEKNKKNKLKIFALVILILIIQVNVSSIYQNDIKQDVKIENKNEIKISDEFLENDDYPIISSFTNDYQIQMYEYKMFTEGSYIVHQFSAALGDGDDRDADLDPSISTLNYATVLNFFTTTNFNTINGTPVQNDEFGDRFLMECMTADVIDGRMFTQAYCTIDSGNGYVVPTNWVNMSFDEEFLMACRFGNETKYQGTLFVFNDPSFDCALKLSFDLEMSVSITSTYLTSNSYSINVLERGFENTYRTVDSTMSLRSPNYKLQIVDNDGIVLHQDNEWVNYSQFRTLNISTLKIINNADELVNITISSVVNEYEYVNSTLDISSQSNNFTIFKQPEENTNIINNFTHVTYSTSKMGKSNIPKGNITGYINHTRVGTSTNSLQFDRNNFTLDANSNMTLFYSVYIPSEWPDNAYSTEYWQLQIKTSDTSERFNMWFGPGYLKVRCDYGASYVQDLTSWSWEADTWLYYSINLNQATDTCSFTDYNTGEVLSWTSSAIEFDFSDAWVQLNWKGDAISHEVYIGQIYWVDGDEYLNYVSPAEYGGTYIDADSKMNVYNGTFHFDDIDNTLSMYLQMNYSTNEMDTNGWNAAPSYQLYNFTDNSWDYIGLGNVQDFIKNDTIIEVTDIADYFNSTGDIRFRINAPCAFLDVSTNIITPNDFKINEFKINLEKSQITTNNKSLLSNTINPYDSFITNMSVVESNYIIYDLYDNVLESGNINLTESNVLTYTPDDYRDCYIIITNQEGEYIDSEEFKMYVNSNRINDVSFAGKLGYEYNLTIYDKFNQEVYSNDITINRTDNFIDISLTLYSLKIINTCENLYGYVNLTLDSNPSLEFSEFIAPSEVIEYELTSSVYLLKLTNPENSTTTEYTITVNSDDAYVILSNFSLETLSSQISDVVRDCFVIITNQEGEYLPYQEFKMYVNGSRIASQYFEGILGSEYNLTINDRFNQLVFNSIVIINNSNNFIDISLTLYSLKIINACEQSFGYVNLTLNSNPDLEFSEYIAPGEIIEYELANAIYLLQLTNPENSTLSNHIVIVNQDRFFVITANFTLSSVNSIIGEKLSVNPELSSIYTNTLFSNEIDWSLDVDEIYDSVLDYQISNIDNEVSLTLYLKYDSEILSYSLTPESNFNPSMLDYDEYDIEYKVEYDNGTVIDWTLIENSTLEFGFYKFDVNEETVSTDLFWLVGFFIFTTGTTLWIIINEKRKDDGEIDSITRTDSFLRLRK